MGVNILLKLAIKREKIQKCGIVVYGKIGSHHALPLRLWSCFSDGKGRFPNKAMEMREHVTPASRLRCNRPARRQQRAQRTAAPSEKMRRNPTGVRAPGAPRLADRLPPSRRWQRR